MNNYYKSKRTKIIGPCIFLILVVIIGFSAKFYFDTYISAISLSGNSMLPTISDGSFAYINKSPIKIPELKYDDIIAFEAIVDEEPIVFLKRVIGVPGDTIKIENGKLFRNDELVHEPYLLEQEWGLETDLEVTLLEHEVFAMGDNRNRSTDSRDIGPVDLNTQYLGLYVENIPSWLIQ